MAKREVIKTFRGDEDVAYYEVEYRDSDGQWVSAAGGWQGGETVKGMYQNAEGASLAARSLNKTHDHYTRTVKVTP